MREGTNRIVITAVSAVIVISAWGCGQRQAELPGESPAFPEELEFSGPESGYPPELVNVTDIRTVGWEEIPGALTDSLEAELRQIVVDDPQLAGQLGERFTYIDAEELFAVKPDDGPAQPTGYRLAFYSYSNNVAFEALFAQKQLDSLQPRKGVQPPVGPGEVEAAARLAMVDGRLDGMPDSLETFGIVLNPRESDERYGNRILHITFAGPDDDLPSYFAYVDMTAERVLKAGPQSTFRDGQP